MKNIIGYFILILIVATPQIFAGSVYYVDITNGNDNNNGLTPETAWKTISKVNDQSFSLGDSILLKRGEVWRENLFVPSSGVNGYPITFGSYGTGANPIINGADLVTSWMFGYDNIWQASLSAAPNTVFFDSTCGNKQTSLDNVDSDKDWYWAANVLYVYYTEGPDGAVVIEAAKREGVVLDNVDYITIQNLHVTHAQRHGMLLLNGASNITIDTCVIEYCGVNGITCNDASGPAIDNVAIQGCTISYCDENGIFAGQYATNWTIDNNDIQHCDVTGANTGAGIEAWGNNVYSGGHIIQHNTVKNNWHGIHIDQVATSCIVRYNLVESNNNEGIFMEKVVGDEVYYNIAISNAACGILVRGVNGDPCSEQKVYNNVCYGNSDYGIRVAGNGAASVVDNFVKNNICDNSTLAELCAVDGGENDGTNGSGNVYEYNCFGAEASNFLKWGGSSYSTYDTWLAASSQSDNNIESNPFMTSPGNDDFTLQASSPCVNAGTDVGLTHDYVGNAMPYGGGVDIGAYEYQGSFGPLTANINTSTTSVAVSIPINFTGNASGGTSPYSYSWDFGDGGSSSNQNPSHTYTNAGTYNVTLTATDAQSSQASDTLTITASSISSYQLSIFAVTGLPAPEAGGTTDPSPGIHANSVGNSVQVEAKPNTNYRFSKWSGDVNDSEIFNKNVTLTMDKDKSISASFFTKCGDVTGDLSITPADAQAAFKIFLNIIANPTESELENADVDCSGTKTEPDITPKDAQAIFEKFLGRNDLPGDCSGNSRSGSVLSPMHSTSMRQAPDVNLMINDIRVDQDGEVIVPIIVDNPFNIATFGFDLLFPSEVLEFVGVARTELLEDFHQVDANKIAEGQVRVGGYGSEAIKSHNPSELVTLIFKVIGEAEDMSLGSFSIINTVDDIKNTSSKNGNVIETIRDPKDIRKKKESIR